MVIHVRGKLSRFQDVTGDQLKFGLLTLTQVLICVQDVAVVDVGLSLDLVQIPAGLSFEEVRSLRIRSVEQLLHALLKVA